MRRGAVLPLRRTHFTGESQPVEVTLDEARSLGIFLEFEMLAAEDQWQLARDQSVRMADHGRIIDLRGAAFSLEDVAGAAAGAVGTLDFVALWLRPVVHVSGRPLCSQWSTDSTSPLHVR